uniref:HIRA interacting protein 3 n=1 Tax=Rousettus aegyptiacus TaxID=9407 RepID=A0A7J8F002_ROUAE|nr:HIRA interacting protein 3 [Rousettus aegyptiacus]
MAREDEMREFTRNFFRCCPDLSTLTHSTVRRHFLAYADRDHLEPEEKQALKRLVEEQLLKMQVSSGRRGEDHPAVMRLKRYIRACGAHRNYKKLLGSCRSHKERLTILRAELESLGMKGNPSLEKCRALKEQREEAAEMASLDITNIISASGRPRRCTAWNPSETATPGELYRRTLDSEEERSRPPPPDWSHMRGIISSDGESN